MPHLCARRRERSGATRTEPDRDSRRRYPRWVLWGSCLLLIVANVINIGADLVYAGMDAVKMLFWSAVANGVLAPPLIVVVVLLTNDPKVMGSLVNPPLLKILGWTAAIVMGVAAVAMFVAG